MRKRRNGWVDDRRWVRVDGRVRPTQRVGVIDHVVGADAVGCVFESGGQPVCGYPGGGVPERW